MPYATDDARRQLLETVARAAEDLAIAIAALSEAYEQADEHTGDALEEELFRPIQAAYGRAQRTYGEFARAYELPEEPFATPPPGAPSRRLRGLLDDALASVQRADATLATLQDSMLPVEVGDASLRAGLEQVRGLIAGVSSRTRELERTLGR